MWCPSPAQKETFCVFPLLLLLEGKVFSFLHLSLECSIQPRSSFSIYKTMNELDEWTMQWKIWLFKFSYLCITPHYLLSSLTYCSTFLNLPHIFPHSCLACSWVSLNPDDLLLFYHLHVSSKPPHVSTLHSHPMSSKTPYFTPTHVAS